MKALQKIKQLHSDTSGSETVEFVGTFGILLLVVMSLIMIIAYVYRVGQLDYVCRRAVRSIEVTGTYDSGATQQLVNKLFPGDAPVEVACMNSVGASIPSGAHIQLRDTFTLNLKSDYQLRMFTRGEDTIFVIPMSISVQGMSEVFDQEQAP